MSDKKYEESLGLDMPMDEALKRIANVKKEDVKDKEVDDDSIILEGEAQIALFKGKEVRQVFHENEWFFSIVDVIEAVTKTKSPRRYWSDLKSQLFEKEGFSELYEIIVQLKMESSDGKMHLI